MKAEFIFVRHGQSQANADTMLANKHSPLTELGKEQARKTGKEVKSLGIKTIACSPFLRAQQTAEIIAGEIGIDIAHIKVIQELHERRLGELEGTTKTRDPIWYETTMGTDGMERRSDLIERMRRCLKKIEELSKDGLVLVVGHSGSGFYLLQIAAGRTKFEQFDPHQQINNADFMVVKLTKNGDRQ